MLVAAAIPEPEIDLEPDLQAPGFAQVPDELRNWNGN